ncbi:anti-sigma factor family protein [Reichenbachiella ulvae]|uniref:Anti-sigma factor n=1 Tax=Reichenbachiella ulvae TaxID=2980104 RepID=A0ABT3CRB5_9BACT|nr:hypothetical protein [Reichenbachiella ulvae]MCV9386225.1 hypothetical protein [Reichenbachiella ulvae]
MENKNDELLIIDYLYGEMSKEEKLRFEERLQSDQELRNHLDQMSTTSDHLQQVMEEEVVIPPFLIHETRSEDRIGFWHSSAVRWTGSVAAAGLILLVAAFALDLRVTQNEGGVLLSFGEVKTTRDDVSRDEVQQWISEAVDEQNQRTKEELASLESSVMDRVDSSEQNQKLALNKAMKKQKANNDEMLKLYVAQLNDGNKKMIENFFLVSNKTQKEYMNKVLADYNEFYQNQRAYDLEMIQSNLGMMENNYSTRQMEQENLLANLYDLVKTQSK